MAAAGDGRVAAGDGTVAAAGDGGVAAVGRPGWGIGARVGALTTSVALLAVLISGLVSVGLVRGAARGEQLATLDRLSRVIVVSFDAAGRQGRTFDRLLASPPISRRLGITVVPVLPGGIPSRFSALVAATPIDLLNRAVQGPAFAVALTLRGRGLLVAGRPRAGGGGYLLYEPATAAAGMTSSLRGRLLLALLAGLAAAELAGLLLARRLARPLQQAASAAHRLATGERAVRLVPRGPPEVAEVSAALNALAGALADSEARQRQFLLSVSHELRTPLTAIKGYAEALADRVVAAQEVAATGGIVLAEATRLERLVADLIDLARLGADDFRIESVPVDLAELLRAAAEVWTARCARHGVQLQLTVPAGPVTVDTDAARLRQIVDGLAENALRVTPAGAPIVLGLQAEAGWAVVEVRDGGPGLSDDDLRVAFERSALYDRYRGVRRVGTGVGLALVAGLAARLGGTVSAGHAAEGGARFAVRLPVGRRTPGP